MSLLISLLLSLRLWNAGLSFLSMTLTSVVPDLVSAQFWTSCLFGGINLILDSDIRVFCFVLFQSSVIRHQLLIDMLIWRFDFSVLDLELYHIEEQQQQGVPQHFFVQRHVEALKVEYTSRFLQNDLNWSILITF